MNNPQCICRFHRFNHRILYFIRHVLCARVCPAIVHKNLQVYRKVKPLFSKIFRALLYLDSSAQTIYLFRFILNVINKCDFIQLDKAV